MSEETCEPNGPPQHGYLGEGEWMPVSKRRKKATRTKPRRPGNPRRLENLRQAIDYTVPIVSEAFVAARPMVPGPQEVLARAVPNDPLAGTELDPISAGLYLTRIREALEEQAHELVQVYPAVQWLWYTRRISTDFFAGYLITTQYADHKVMETLSGLSTNATENQPEVKGRSIYPCETSDLIPVAQLAAISVALSRCHSWIRRAGKGTDFVVVDGDLPEPVVDEPLEQAIDIFDQRLADDLQWQWHPSMEVNPVAPDRRDPPSVLMTVSRVLGPWIDVPGWQGQLRHGHMVRVLGQFNLNWITLNGLAESMSAAGASSIDWWRPHTPSLATLLYTLWYDATFISESLGSSLPKVGYLRRRRDYAIHTIDQLMPIIRDGLEACFPGQVPEDGHQVLQVLEGLGPDLWPIETGPVVRSLGEDVVLDVWAASSRLLDDIRIPAQTGGEVVNAPARRFEEVVQERIDQSPWRPADSARALRRHLRLGGAWLTDIDAVAERNGVLLLVSCKNIPFTREYDAGDYKTVRNAATTIDKACRLWEGIVATLKGSPVGDNYDVSQFIDVKGVVVTPQVLYSRSDLTFAETSIGQMRLRGAVSLGELTRALG